MVTIDTPRIDFDAIQPSIRPYSSEDFAWAVGLLESSGGRHRVRRGKVIDVAILPGLVAERGGQAIALLTLARHREELELSVIASSPFDETLIDLLIDAAKTYASPTCRRVYSICSNAEFDVQRCLQRYGFRLCAVRPGAVDALVRRSQVPLVHTLDGVSLRDEIEFDQLLP
jgi:hypothetical protein